MDSLHMEKLRQLKVPAVLYFFFSLFHLLLQEIAELEVGAIICTLVVSFFLAENDIYFSKI